MIPPVSQHSHPSHGSPGCSRTYEYARSTPGSPIIAAFSDSLFLSTVRHQQALRLCQSSGLLGIFCLCFFATQGTVLICRRRIGEVGADVSHVSPEPRNRALLSCLKHLALPIAVSIFDVVKLADAEQCLRVTYAVTCGKTLSLRSITRYKNKNK